MKLHDVGEFGAIEKIAGAATRGRGGPGDFLKTGIGDDAAVFDVGAGYDCLLTTDLLVEGVHFDLSYAGFRDLGYKALAANLSDIAAMGGEPLIYFVSIAAPGEMEFRDFRRIFAGMEDAARNARLAGGDTCSTPGPLFINVSVIGRAQKGRAVKRSGARPGDGIWVTGTLGDSAAGLEILKAGAGGQGAAGKSSGKFPVIPAKAGTRRLPIFQQKSLGPRFRRGDDLKYLVSRHLMPEARVETGRLLCENGIASSMIDISDGLSSDLRHITEASGTGAIIYGEKLPVSRELAGYAGREKAVRFALSGGEDYELLFTVRGPRKESGLLELGKKTGVTFTKIGEVQSGGRVYLELGGKRKALKPEGYEHFEYRGKN